jgi:hypothetical protein
MQTGFTGTTRWNGQKKIFFYSESRRVERRIHKAEYSRASGLLIDIQSLAEKVRDGLLL